MKLSIITVNYNNASGLQKTIESVVSQSYTDFEYIIIDGASTDKSVDVIKKFENKLTYWESEPDSGIYNAMNKGIEISKGDYLYFLNSGDAFIDNDTLQHFIDRSHLGDYDLVYGDVFLNYKHDFKDRILKFPDQLNFYFLGCYSSLPHQATLIRKSLFNTYGLYDESLKIVSDWKFCVDMLFLKGKSYLHVDLTVCDYDMYGISSVENGNKNIILMEREAVLQNLFPNWQSDIKIIREYYENKNQQHISLFKKIMFRLKKIFLR